MEAPAALSTRTRRITSISIGAKMISGSVNRTSRKVWSVFLTLLLVACVDEAAEQPATRHTIQNFDTIASAATTTIAVVSDLAVAPDGTLWIADRANHNLVSITGGGDRQQTYGRQGSGPGEL